MVRRPLIDEQFTVGPLTFDFFFPSFLTNRLDGDFQDEKQFLIVQIQGL